MVAVAVHPFLRIVREIPSEVRSIIPAFVAYAHAAAPFALGDAGAKVAMRHPDDRAAIRAVERCAGMPVFPHAASPDALHSALAQIGPDIRTAYAALAATLRDATLPREEYAAALETLWTSLLRDAADARAADVLLEPSHEGATVQFRIAGQRYDVVTLPRATSRAFAAMVAERSGIRGNLRQLLRGSAAAAHHAIITPTAYGERMLLRCRAAPERQYSIANIGCVGRDRAVLRDASVRPHGVLFVAGPPGGGVTTTLYSILHLRNRRGARTATLEHPIAFAIPGSDQQDVAYGSDRSAAALLRERARAGYDTIALDVACDAEAVDAAMRAAATGRFVCATMHADDVSTALRMITADGRNAALAAAATHAIVAQRLLRRVCNACRVSHAFSDDVQRRLALIPAARATLRVHGYPDLASARGLRGIGCDACRFTGYAGRVGIFEVLPMTDALRQLVASRTPHAAIMAQGRADGMSSMFEDAVGKMCDGLVSVEDVLALPS